jgi:hypothetical protein
VGSGKVLRLQIHDQDSLITFVIDLSLLGHKSPF